MPRVYNKNSEDYPRDAVYIGRPSIWGNPFVIGREGDRDEVISEYRRYVLLSTHLMREIGNLAGKDLVCFCAPRPCHGDVLLELANPEL